VGDAVSWAWNKLGKNAVPLLVAGLIYFVVRIVLGIGYQILEYGGEPGRSIESGATSTSPGWAFAWLAIVYAVDIFIWAALLTGCLEIADGKPVTIGSFFKPRNLGPAILAALLVGILTLIGLFLLIIPGIIFAVLAAFTLFFVIDRSLAPVEALKASIATVRSNVGGVLLTLVVTILMTIVGALACTVGLIVAVPLSALIWTYAYRRLSGGWVAPVEQPGY
jgi:uncharacterized membrane protein